MRETYLSDAFIAISGLPQAERGFRFALPRRWTFDLCWPALRLALEIEGGSFIQGRHTRGVGFRKDIDKYNEATLRGWRLVRCTPAMIEDGSLMELLRRAFETYQT